MTANRLSSQVYVRMCYSVQLSNLFTAPAPPVTDIHSLTQEGSVVRVEWIKQQVMVALVIIALSGIHLRGKHSLICTRDT